MNKVMIVNEKYFVKFSAVKNNAGFTLIELLIVVAIIGILLSLAIPAYQDSILRGRRSVAVSGLMDLANREEQFYLNNKVYTSDLTNLGYTAGLVFDLAGDSAVTLNENQSLVAAASAESIYVIKIDSASALAFSISAVPQQGQTADAECNTFTLTNTSARTESGTGNPSDCW